MNDLKQILDEEIEFAVSEAFQSETTLKTRIEVVACDTVIFLFKHEESEQQESAVTIAIVSSNNVQITTCSKKNGNIDNKEQHKVIQDTIRDIGYKL